ncbi:MAG TPA: hypothetical protein VK963_00015 [Candidatus Saccharimonadales bacterium]|nr:hypothetical protein [Candidatus Saccharimonadales bacterium]
MSQSSSQASSRPNCPPVMKRLRLFLWPDELDAAARAALRQHVDTCQRCQQDEKIAQTDKHLLRSADEGS